MEHVDYVYTAGMSDEEISGKLRDSYAGVLSLAAAGDAYAVPVSHHFDGDRLLVRLIDDGDSQKFSYVETTDTATFTVMEASGPGVAWSVVARGRLAPYSELDDTSINELFEPVHVFDEPIDDVDVTVYEFQVDSLVGRQTEE